MKAPPPPAPALTAHRASETTGPEPRRLGLPTAAAVVMANMIGTGVFTTTGFVIEGIGSPLEVLAVWVLGGVLALCGAAVYAELGAAMPRAGGEYVYLSRAYHPAVGFLSGWISLWVGFSAPVAASALAFGSYMNAAWPALPPTTSALLLLAAITVLHMADVTWGARVQTAATLIKLLLVVGFVVVGFSSQRGSWQHLVESTRDSASSGWLGGWAGGLVLVSFSYSGWNAAAYLAGEIRNPARVLPRALLMGTGVVAILYLALNLLLFYAVPAERLAGELEVGHIAATSLFGKQAGQALSIAIGLALVSSVSAMMMAGPRVYMAMAHDGLFFAALGRRNRRGAPVISVALQAVLAAAMILTATFERLLIYIGFTLSLSAALTVGAAFILRRRTPPEARPFSAPAWPWSGLAFLALSAWMLVWAVAARPLESMAGVLTLAVGGLFYRGRRRTSASA